MTSLDDAHHIDVDMLQTQIDALATRLDTTETADSDPATVLTHAAEETRAELSRADQKTATLTTVASLAATVAGAVLTQTRPGIIVTTLAAVGVGLLVTTVVFLLNAIRPRTGGSGGAATRLAWPHYIHYDAPSIAAQLVAWHTIDYQAQRIAELSRIVASKYAAVRTAVILLTAGVLTLAAAGVAATVTALT